ncbi:hypothetical protein GCM10023191_023220 [Actinoallomurus oryzae]|uniref:Uncharacterized protein n=1 Tax=Actinoallomurus oryzae TaxID=502180 RepID=A0ABP8PR27_9ACTN
MTGPSGRPSPPSRASPAIWVEITSVVTVAGVAAMAPRTAAANARHIDSGSASARPPPRVA